MYICPQKIKTCLDCNYLITCFICKQLLYNLNTSGKMEICETFLKNLFGILITPKLILLSFFFFFLSCIHSLGTLKWYKIKCVYKHLINEKLQKAILVLLV